MPSETLGNGRSLSFVPSECPFDPAEVVELGLDLAEEERSIQRPVGEEVDPATPSA